MPVKDLGSKHACFKCGTKFYDMKKPVPVCPKCGADQRESPALKAPPSEKRSRAAAKVVEPVVDELEAVEELDEELDEDDEDEAEDDA
ncbi:MAG: TIGR02300 family protein [Anaeromyxobacter sp.]|nr:TIGR02300 family protein [Anaeromyxobacter sp.]MBL0277425.1 TIGR02300 family protein [Anaeromyxobacter sp.]